MDKLVSVVIPTYSRKELTDAAVASVCTSFPSQVEIVVVDDSGFPAYLYDTTNSSGVLVRVFRLEQNVGAGMARQVGVEKAVGRYIAFLDSDDHYDEAWIDSLINLLQANAEIACHGVVISGLTKGGRMSAALTRKVLTMMPEHLRLFAARLIAVIFNPFYTPSLVMNKELCSFMAGLRHCEDYFSNAFALFGASSVLLPPVVACHLGRAPNSGGGESAAQNKMFRGEWSVRCAMLRSPHIPFGYRLLVPVGMVYQWCRAGLKRLFRVMGNR